MNLYFVCSECNEDQIGLYAFLTPEGAKVHERLLTIHTRPVTYTVEDLEP